MPSYISTAFLSLLAFFGAAQGEGETFQGYIEAEYVLVAPQIPGTLEALGVQKGGQVQEGDDLFALERGAETAALQKAKAATEQQAAQLDDLLKSKRQPELDALIAQKDQATAAYHLAKINLDRDEKLIKTKAISDSDWDARKADLSQKKAKLDEAEAALATGQLSIGRDDAIRAAQAALAAAKAAEAEAQWRLDQKKVSALQSGFVFDTMFRPGEYIAAGQPVVSLLPRENIKVRFFVPEPVLTRLSKDQPVFIEDQSGQGCIPARIAYISPRAEYSPPQLFNRDNREKLLYMIEAVPMTPAFKLHPGQPVDVRLAPVAKPNAS